jgi:hypothetical protein
MTPFLAVYGRSPPTLLSYVPGTARVSGVEEELLRRDDVLKLLHENLELARSRMKKFADRHRLDRNFSVGD